MWNYIYYSIYLDQIDVTNHNAIEKYIHQKVTACMCNSQLLTMQAPCMMMTIVVLQLCSYAHIAGKIISHYLKFQMICGNINYIPFEKALVLEKHVQDEENELKRDLQQLENKMNSLLQNLSSIKVLMGQFQTRDFETHRPWAVANRAQLLRYRSCWWRCLTIRTQPGYKF